MAAVASIAGLLIVAMLVAGGFLINKKSELSSLADMRGCLVAAAESTVNDMMNVTAENVDEKFQSMLDGSTGTFHDQLEGTRSQFTELSREADVSQQGSILASAVEDNTDTAGTVLLVSEGSITNANTAAPAESSYRVRASVEKVDGVCKTSKVEWVI